MGIMASGGPSGQAGYVGSELIAEDGTIPLKIVIRCLADTTGLLWKREERHSRLYCFMPDALFITHVYFVGPHPHTVWHGTTQVTAKHTHLETLERTPAGEISWADILKQFPPFAECPLEPWVFADPKRFFIDELPENETDHPRTFMYYEEYKGKYGLTQLTALNFTPRNR